MSENGGKIYKRNPYILALNAFRYGTSLPSCCLCILGSSQTDCGDIWLSMDSTLLTKVLIESLNSEKDKFIDFEKV
jgi:hypothetical protein